IEGDEFSSLDFSKKLEKISISCSSVTFIIGGSFGLSANVKQLGKSRLSLGKITLPHQLARLVLLEQIYRAFSISNNSKYHK
ncbi:MAG: 23S rRNA (pseudouridine(1915)-N(3))-methyltransferase RlmH, partial [Clostridiales bacterium]|nr:23S rRNA (pseudouridine(1915)-N(3))-methyltransferase RlmH [Clostridiales bacterium]